MGFDFTIAVYPDNKSVDRDLYFIKAALLYADKVRLISPLTYLYVQLSDESNKLNEKSAIRMIKKIMPLAKVCDTEIYNSSVPVLEQLEKIVYSKNYNSYPLVKKLDLQRMLKKMTAGVNEKVSEFIGFEQCKELHTLIKNNQVAIEKFDSSIGDATTYGLEFFDKMRKSLNSSYPLFDEASNDLMNAALNSNIVNLSDIEKRKIAHAGLADNYIQKLPSFEEASVDEIIDIKKELQPYVVRFRGKMLGFSSQINSMPWDKNFAPECQMLFDKDVAPAILEIEEKTKENTFVKNLGHQILGDENAWKTAGGICVSIAASGVIQSFTEVASSDVSTYLTASTLAVPAVALTQKIYNAHTEYSTQKKSIEHSDLYFYYKAGKKLEKNKG
jgi:hypothetical protein